MATWISHMMISDNLLNRGLYLDKTGFCVGNIAPDCNVENEDWTEFIPPRKVTHWMTGKSKLTADYEAFYKEYIHEINYLKKNPESAHNTVLRKIDDFPDYMDILPKGAIIRKIKIMAYEPAEESQDEFVFFEPNEYQNFIDRTSDHIYEMLQNKMRVNFVLTGKKKQN